MKPFNSLDEARTFAASAAGPVSVMMNQPPHPTRLDLPGYRIGRTFWIATAGGSSFEQAIDATYQPAAIRYTTPTTHLHFCPSCNRTWEHSNTGCDKPTPGVRCEGCEGTARQAAVCSAMYER